MLIRMFHQWTVNLKVTANMYFLIEFLTHSSTFINTSNYLKKTAICAISRSLVNLAPFAKNGNSLLLETLMT